MKRAFLDDVKSRPCADCGNEYPPCVMDFHHSDRTTKEFNVSILSMGIERLAEEIVKCEVLCANCHRLREWSPRAT